MSFRIGREVLAVAAAALLPLSFATAQRGGSRSGASSNAPYYSGHVTFEDGSVPKDRVVIESVCSGRVRQETTIDSRGGFGFRLGAGSGDAMLDSANSTSRAGSGAESGNISECVIRANLNGYTSNLVYLGNLDPGKPDLGTLILKKAAPSPTASATSQKASKDARKAFDKGAGAAKDKKWEDAAKNFQKAVELYPEYAEAWCELGKAQTALNQPEAARKSFETATKADDKFVAPYLQLATIETRGQNWKALVEISDKVILLVPDSYPQMYLVNAISNINLKNFPAAEKSSRAGLAIDKQHAAPRLHQVLGSILGDRGDYAAAAEQFQTYLKYAPFAPDAARTKDMLDECLKRAAAAAPAKQ